MDLPLACSEPSPPDSLCKNLGRNLIALPHKTTRARFEIAGNVHRWRIHSPHGASAALTKAVISRVHGLCQEQNAVYEDFFEEKLRIGNDRDLGKTMSCGSSFFC